MSAITDWTSGKPCERHEMPFCFDCRELAGMKRTADGTVSWKSDCTVQTFVEITGATYDEATEFLRAAGFRPGRGATSDQVRAAFAAAGYTVREATHHRLDGALRLSHQGRSFYVSGHKPKSGHAWSLIAGKANRPMQPPFRYRIFEVIA